MREKIVHRESILKEAELGTSEWWIKKCIKFNQSKPGNLKFCAPFKIHVQKRVGLSNFEKPVFDFSVLYPKKSGLSKKLSVHIGY